MKKIVKIEGLHCPNCARSLANEINKIDTVKNAEIDVVKSVLSFESSDVDADLEKIIKLTKKIEPDVVIVATKTKNNKVKLFMDLAMLLVGIILAVVCLIVPMNRVLFWIVFAISAIMLGYKTYYKAFILLLKGTINENLLLTISVVGATLLGEYMEALMVIALYSIGKVFEGLAVNKSRKSIENLMNMQPEFAVVLKDGKEIKMEPKDVKIGDVLLVKPGEKVAIDGEVVFGNAMLDKQSLTGESLPEEVGVGEVVMSGSIVTDGVLQIKTTTNYDDSTVSKIMHLIEHASEKKSKTETLISKITKWYTLGVIICALSVWGIMWAITANLNTAIYRGLIFLVVSCPCAFAISVPLTYFSGIGNASKHGILIKGSNYLDACSKLNLIAFDKTGTLTTGKFVVNEVKVLNNDYNIEDIIYLASLGERYSLHPLAKAIVEYNKKELIEVKNVKEIAGKGVTYSLDKINYFIGRKSRGLKATVVEVYKDEDKLGEIILSDQVKETSKNICSELKKLKVNSVLLSGDNAESVTKIVDELSLTEGYGDMLPEDKFNWINDKKQQDNFNIGYVGDGINDSPSLMLADVGISMGINGSPASIEASDIVLVDDNPAKVATAIKISKFTQKIVWQNIIFSAMIKFIFLALGTIGLTGMLSAVFADVGVTVLAILNSMRALIYSPNKAKNKSKKNNL